MVIERTFHSMTNVKQRQAIVSNLSINIPNLMSYLDGADLKKVLLCTFTQVTSQYVWKEVNPKNIQLPLVDLEEIIERCLT